MSELTDRVKENIRKLPDEALVKMLGADSRDYENEALDFASKELARRGAPPVQAPSADTPPAADTPSPGHRSASAPPAPKGKATRVWGAIWIVLASILIYTATLAMATIIAAKGLGMRVKSELPGYILIYLALAGLLLWAGIKRRPRWEAYLGSSLAIIAILLFVASFSVKGAMSGTLFSKAGLMAAIILLAGGGLMFLLDLAARRSSK